MDYWKIIISVFDALGIPYDGNMVVEGADELKSRISERETGKVEKALSREDCAAIASSLFAKWKMQYNVDMIDTCAGVLEGSAMPARKEQQCEVDADILKATLDEEKRQFTDEEYKLLHDLHGVNSPYGIGYYMGRLAQKVEDEKHMVKWHPASEAPTEHWGKNDAISPMYLVKCAGTGTDGMTILGYANYTFVSNAWIDCFHATERGNWRVVEWAEAKL